MATAGLSIRAARLEDLPAIVAIYNASIPGRRSTADLAPVTVESRTAWFVMHEQDRRPLWVAERGEEGVVGWLSLSDFRNRRAYDATAEVGVYVADAAHGTGVGSALLGRAIEVGPSLGIRTLLWVSFDANVASIALAKRHGFARWGLLPRVTDMDGELADVAILGLELASGGTPNRLTT